MSSALGIYLKVQPSSFRRFPFHAVPLDASKGKKCKVLKKEISEKDLEEKIFCVPSTAKYTHSQINWYNKKDAFKCSHEDT